MPIFAEKEQFDLAFVQLSDASLRIAFPRSGGVKAGCGFTRDNNGFLKPTNAAISFGFFQYDNHGNLVPRSS